MFRPHTNDREVSRRVARLPLDYAVHRLEDHWIVVGPTGVVVVGGGGDDPLPAAEATVALAHRLRSRLSEVMPWVPFIDAMVVARDSGARLPCAAVDIGTLEMALLSGPPAIDQDGLALLRHHVPRVLSSLGAPVDLNASAAGEPIDTGA